MPDVDAIGIVVSDLRRAVSFYRALGLAFPEGAEESEHGHAEVALTGGMRLMLDTEAGIRSFDPGLAAVVRLTRDVCRHPLREPCRGR